MVQLYLTMPEALVRLVTDRCGLPDELGVKGQSGVLQSMPSRAAFLSDPAHRLQFLYTPTHTSWLTAYPKGVRAWRSLR